MTPQQLYLSKDDNRKWFAGHFNTIQSEEALQAVFAQYCLGLGSAVEGGPAIALNAKRQGAADLLHAIATFTLPPQAPKPTTTEGTLLDTTIRSGSTVPVSKPKQ